ncbi:MAG: hypothetical protein U9M90_04330 [Patescibacteria group bacterium]|nr:hypothetical protein [Patescibacteria group bacterium]
MLTQDTTPEIIFKAAKKGIKFVKFIPVGTSTGAVKGLRLDDSDKLYKIFPAIEETGMYLPLHAELMSFINGKAIHLQDREEAAISIVFAFHKHFPKMKITIEHVSTAKMINFVQSQDSANVRATLTPQHALLTYSDVFDHNDHLINPYNYCLPVAKKEIDRQAVIAAMVSGDERFFAGADSAPHWAKLKAGDNPPAGIFFEPAEFPLWVKIFESKSALHRLENFTSRFGAEYYGYPLNSGTITLVQEEWELPIIENGIRYCKGGEIIRWKVVE